MSRLPVDPVSVVAALPPDADAVAVRDGERTVVGIHPREVLACSGREALDALDALGGGWWAGWIAYDLGRAIERVTPRAGDDLGLPDVLLGRFDARILIDANGARVEGGGPARRALERALRWARSGTVPAPPGPALGGWASSLDEDAFTAACRTALGHIAAGDCYQVNLTRRLTCETAADPVALYGALARHNPAPFAALARFGPAAVVSASPERFLSRAGDRVETAPIKGTGREAGPLARSAKDRAENVMIVDLARNDLGRVCIPGTIRVPQLCAVEEHPGLFHLVSRVTGRLRPGVGPGTLIEATFPPASITGAPKPRVMQIIEDLEPVRRGPYCGAIGWIDATAAAMSLSVAIRTFTIAGGRTHLGVGGGIVADSDPQAEWRETELKAARLLEAAALEGSLERRAQ